MMKKITACFLVMAIAVGCSQAPVEPEKPVEPPVIEQPQKPVEQEKPEEETKVKKIDESKDWVVTTNVIQESIDFASDLEKQRCEDMMFENGNPFENWYNTIYTTKPEIVDFYVNIESEGARTINENIQKAIADRSKIKLGYSFLTMNYFVSEQFLSVIIKEGSFLPGSDFKYQGPSIFIFDLKIGSILKNEELLKLFNISIEDIQKTLEQKYVDYNSNQCDFISNLPEKSNFNCHGSYDSMKEQLDSLPLFVDENNKLILMDNFYVKNKEMYITTAYKIELN